MIIKSDQIVYAMDKDNEPVAKAKSMDTIVFETLDCFSCEIQSEDDKLAGINFDKVNPATGPVYIEDAEVGDVLKVTIDKITVEDQGVSIVEPGLGRLGDKIEEAETGIISIDGDTANFKGIEVPLNKMVGVIGTAPAGEKVATGVPGDHGGNLDCTQVAEGNTIYLPVEVDGALLAMGDLHAAMGDGEIGGAAVEVSGEVEVTVEVIKDFKYKTPMIETPERWIAIGSRESIDEATDLALNNLSELIMDKTGLLLNQATMLMTFATDVITCQIVNPWVTMRAEIDKAIVDQESK